MNRKVIVPPASAAKAAFSMFAKRANSIMQTIPVVGQIAQTFKEIYDVYEKTTKNKAEASSAIKRCSLLSEVIMKCVDGNASLNEQQLQGIRLLHGQLKEMLSLVKAYCLRILLCKR